MIEVILEDIFKCFLILMIMIKSLDYKKLLKINLRIM